VRVVVFVGLFEAQAVRAKEREAVVSAQEIAYLQLSLAAALYVEVSQRAVSGFVHAAEVPLEERSEFGKMGVYHNGLTNGSILRSAELVDEVAEVVEVGIALVRGVVCDGELHLAEHRRVVQSNVDEKVAVTGVESVLYAVNG